MGRVCCLVGTVHQGATAPWFSGCVALADGYMVAQASTDCKHFFMIFISLYILYKTGLVLLCIMLHRVTGGVYRCMDGVTGGLWVALWGHWWLVVAR